MPIKRLFGSEEKISKRDLHDKDAPAQQNPAHLQPSGAPDQDTAGKQTVELVYEKDNRAARIFRLSQANDFWEEYEKRRLKVPFLRYAFATELQAMEALLSVKCIHQASDTGHLVCSESITLGCYRILDGRYEVFLAGNDLSYATWSEAARKFPDHHGRYRDQLKPETDDRFKDRRSTAQQVVFEKEYYQLSPADTHFYQVFRAPSATAARSFLLQHENMVVVRNRSILVQTPEGTLCSDIDGIHEMRREEDSC